MTNVQLKHRVIALQLQTYNYMKNGILITVLALLSITSWQCGTLSKLGIIPSELEMSGGLKGALQQGLFKGFDAFANPNSNANLLLKLPLELDKMESLLGLAGVKVPVADISKKITSAMTSSMLTAKPIFIQALKEMSIRDASKILITNNSHAATDYFKLAVTDSLTKALMPIIDSTVKVQDADKEYKQIVGIVNNIPFSNKKLEPNLNAFIAGRTLDIMFAMIANEEAQIRSKYSLGKTDLVRKAFSYAEQEVKRKYGISVPPAQ